MSAISAGAPVTPDRDSAQQSAARELAQGKYHLTPSPSPAAPSASPTPSVASPSPSPTPTASNSQHHSGTGTILLVVLLIVVLGAVLLLILRKIGKPRKDEKSEPDKPKRSGAATARHEIPLTGAALQRHNAEQAAHAGDWQEAIRARFRGVIAELDERSLLPERKDRTANEAAQDAVVVLPGHAAALLDAARAFGEVEYGDYLGTPEGYAVISAVDDAIGHGSNTAVGR